MGLYINETSKGPLQAKGKLAALLEDGAEVIGMGDGDNVPFQEDLVCLVHNGPFEAALYCVDKSEYNAVVQHPDARPKLWLKYPNVQQYAH